MNKEKLYHILQIFITEQTLRLCSCWGILAVEVPLGRFSPHCSHASYAQPMLRMTVTMHLVLMDGPWYALVKVASFSEKNNFELLDLPRGIKSGPAYNCKSIKNYAK